MAEQTREQAAQPARSADPAVTKLDTDKVHSTMMGQAPELTTEPAPVANDTSPEFATHNLQAIGTSATIAQQVPELAISPARATSFTASELITSEPQPSPAEQAPEQVKQPESPVNYLELTAHENQPPMAEQAPEQATQLESSDNYTSMGLTAGNLHTGNTPGTMIEEMTEEATQPASTANFTPMELTSENLQAATGSATSTEQLPEQSSQLTPGANYAALELTADEIVGANLHIDTAEQSDQDSALGEDGYSTSASSLNSDITDFRTFDKRRYHAFNENQYWLPNDDEEISRLELQHLVWRLCLNGRLHIAPIPPDVHRVLDLGTGTGKWAIEFADLHPSAEVIGTDLSPIQPISVPSNCSFIVENVEDEWVYPEPFDYIHSRMLCLGIHDWKRYFQQCYDNLKPGGWCEVQETKFPIHSASPSETPENSPLIMWSEYVRQAAMNDGIESNPGPFFRGYLEEIGFTDIREQPLQWPIGPWPKGNREKLIGRIMIDNVKQFYRPSAMALYTKRLGWTAEQVEEFLPSVGKDLEDRTRHYYVQMHIVAARKPDNETY